MKNIKIDYSFVVEPVKMRWSIAFDIVLNVNTSFQMKKEDCICTAKKIFIYAVYIAVIAGGNG